MDLDPTKKNCSFCGDPGRHDKPLVGGLGAFMCGDCVDYYAGVAAAERCKERGPPPWESMSDADILGKLKLILQNGAQVDRFLAEWVLLARSRKLSWAEIGKAWDFPAGGLGAVRSGRGRGGHDARARPRLGLADPHARPGGLSRYSPVASQARLRPRQDTLSNVRTS